MNKIKTNPLASFLMGALTATWALILIYCLTIGPNLSKTETPSSQVTSTENSTGEIKSYNTSIKEWAVTTKSGEAFTFYTPNEFYSLSDRYLEQMGTYYGKTLTSDSIVVVGNSHDLNSVTTYLNANTISDVEVLLKQLYGDEFSEENMSVSEALHYMQNGELPEDVPLNYTIKEIKKYTVNDVEFHAYAIAYDMEYENEEAVEESTETTETTKEVQHIQQVLCYSDTEDPVEIVVTQTTYDEAAALKLLDEFLGQK